jgi:hypothetical protein
VVISSSSSPQLVLFEETNRQTSRSRSLSHSRCRDIQKPRKMTAVESVKLADTLNRAWKDDKTGFGYRMLQKMGWKEEKGLGKNEDGMAAAVKVSKREEGLGLGVAKDAAGNSGWSSTVSGFSAVLDLLNSTYATQPAKSKKKKTPSIQVRIK